MKNIKTTEKQASTPIQSWIRRAEKNQPPKIDYYSELSNWLQHAMTEAEKNKNSNKEDQLSTLLKDPLELPKNDYAMEMTRRKE